MSFIYLLNLFSTIWTYILLYIIIALLTYTMFTLKIYLLMFVIIKITKTNWTIIYLYWFKV